MKQQLDLLIADETEIENSTMGKEVACDNGAVNKSGGRIRRDSMRDSKEDKLVEAMLPQVGMVRLPVVKGDFQQLPSGVQRFILENVSTLS